MPQAEDVVATATRSLADFDVDDERSLAAEVRGTPWPTRSRCRARRAERAGRSSTVGGVDVTPMSWVQVVVLSIVQGLTEFLPIRRRVTSRSSRVFFAGDAGASFTAVSQLGTEAAVIIYFARDIGRILKAWFNGLLIKAHRDNVDYRLGWYVIIGTLPIVVLGWRSGT